jgi:phosphoribosylformylglycinamidine synthase I
MGVRVGVVVFPGSNCDRDTVHALDLAGAEPVVLWHEQASLDGVAAVVLPGGFAYGDYLRAGVIARFSPVMRAVTAFADAGGLVLGICNGFQVLAEAHLVPGALLRNASLRFAGQEVRIAAQRVDTRFTHALEVGRPLRMPVAHGEGCYFADDPTLDAIEAADGVLFRYVDAAGAVAGPEDPANPNGSLRAIAGILNRERNVMGMMPHPDRASDPLMGSTDGLQVFRSMLAAGVRA